MEPKKKKEKKAPDPKLVEIGRRVRAVRLAEKLTMEQAAERADFSTQFLSKIEKGEQSMTALKLKNLSLALGVSSDYLLTGWPSHSERVSLGAELLSRLSPTDLEVVIDTTGNYWRVMNDFQAKTAKLNSH